VRILLKPTFDLREPFCDAASQSIAGLGCEVIRPDGGAWTADALVLLLGNHYGSVQENGLSESHEAYRRARERCPVFVFAQAGGEMDSRQRAFLGETERWGSGHPTTRFGTPDELREHVTSILGRWRTAQSSGVVDLDELRARAARLTPERGTLSHAGFCVVVVGWPWLQVVDPRRLEGPGFSGTLQRDAMYGDDPILEADAATSTHLADGVLSLVQTHASLLVTSDGALRVICSWKQHASRASVVTHEYMCERLSHVFGFMATILRRVDPTRQLTDILPIVIGLGAKNWIWRTGQEQHASPTAIAIDLDPNVVRLELTPPMLKRAALDEHARWLADDFVLLLRGRSKVPDLIALSEP
jgi:hypothetical protein